MVAGSYSFFSTRSCSTFSTSSSDVLNSITWFLSVFRGSKRHHAKFFSSSHVRTDYYTRMGGERKKMLLLSAGIAAVFWESCRFDLVAICLHFPPPPSSSCFFLSYDTRKASFFGEVAGFLIGQKREPNEIKTRNATFREYLTK